MSKDSWIREALLDGGFAALGTLISLLLLFWIDEQWWPASAIGCGIVSGVVLRRAVEPSYATFPGFLRRPLNVGLVLVGTLLAVWATLVGQGVTYVLAHLQAALILPAVAALLGLAIATQVYSHARMRREVEQHRIREAVLRETALRAQLKALQAQINPHFLFNAFNALAELTQEDPDLAEEMISDLAHLLRYSLRSSAVGTVALSQEIEAVDRYLRVERARLGGRLRVERAIDPGVAEVQVPGLILQPLVENAVQHAVAPRPGGGDVRIEVCADGDAVRIRVADNGPGVPAEIEAELRRFAADGADEVAASTAALGTAGAGGGLLNVVRRLALSYRGAAELSLGPPGEPGFRIEIRVPR